MPKKQLSGFEEQMHRLDEIVQELEQGDPNLECNVALYKEGRALARSCAELLERARHEISLCDADGAQVPFEAAGADEQEKQ